MCWCRLWNGQHEHLNFAQSNAFVSDEKTCVFYIVVGWRCPSGQETRTFSSQHIAFSRSGQTWKPFRSQMCVCLCMWPIICVCVSWREKDVEDVRPSAETLTHITAHSTRCNIQFCDDFYIFIHFGSARNGQSYYWDMIAIDSLNRINNNNLVGTTFFVYFSHFDIITISISIVDDRFVRRPIARGIGHWAARGKASVTFKLCRRIESASPQKTTRIAKIKWNKIARDHEIYISPDYSVSAQKSFFFVSRVFFRAIPTGDR